ncbi:hypothetical protein CI102_2091 [Trichoderma harzianum]|nr:hypothetical protein CI102_2091 [Trichoderma harzianum]
MTYTSSLQRERIIDNALRRGPAPTWKSLTLASAAQTVKATIFIGNPPFQFELPDEIGTYGLGGICVHPKHNCL